MVAPAPEEVVAIEEEVVTIEETMPQPSKDSDSGESYEAQPDDMSVSTADIEIAIRVACASEAFLGRHFRCNKVGHCFPDEDTKYMTLTFKTQGWDLQRPVRTDRSLERRMHAS